MRTIVLWIMLTASLFPMNAQQNTKKEPFVRMADIEVYPEHWDAFLQEARTVGVLSVEKEEGVICLFPMQIKEQPYAIRVMEVYADTAAYRHHITTPHFLHYKEATLPMVKSLKLLDADAVDKASIPHLFAKLSRPRAQLNRLITVEEHFIIPSISAKVLAWQTEKNGGKLPISEVQRDLMKIVLPTNEDIADIGERRLRFMDEAGVTMQVLSYGAGNPQNVTDTALAVGLCREANNLLASLIAKHPDRFAGFALLPVADPVAAADELERCVRELGFKGAMLNGSFNGLLFDNERFYPIYERAEMLGVPVFMHPAIIASDVANYYYRSDAWSPVAAAMFATAGYGWHVDSGITVLRMIMSGLFERYPKLQIISGHWGELVPFYLNRLDDQQSKTLNLPRKISDYYKSNIHIAPSGLFSEAQLKYAIEAVGADRIIYSADYPFLTDKNTRRFLENADISAEDKEKIAYRNAEKLLNLFP